MVVLPLTFSEYLPFIKHRIAKRFDLPLKNAPDKTGNNRYEKNSTKYGQ